MIGQLCEILDGFGYPTFLQGTINPDDALPDSFFTFWNYSTPEACFYDNDANTAVWGFWVYFYSTDRQTVEETIEAARAALKAAGWIPQGRAQDARSDVPTHTGRMFSVRVIENLTKGE